MPFETPVPENVPPVGLPPVNVNAAELTQTGENGSSVTLTVEEFTVIGEVAVPEHPLLLVYIYEIVCVPTPADIGSKIPPDTPGPEYTPPAGDPPVKVKGASETSTFAKALNDTAGNVRLTD
jgi:hypothetical protein